MRAIVITGFGDPSVLQEKKVSKPTPIEGDVLIRVKAFGLNHAEMHMRKGEWDEYNPISGLECVGLVEADPSNTYKPGDKVIGVMGGMGRNRPGSYGEFVNVPLTNVVSVDTNLPWEDLAALPEVYSCASSCVFTVLDVQKGERLLIRGATSTIGQAAVNLAVNAGAKVTATTRRKERFDMLKKMGVESAILEPNPKTLAQDFTSQKFDKTLNLIGNSALLDSIRLTRPGGRMLQAGWLGGLAPVKDFNPMVEMESGVHFSLFHSKELGTDDFPLSGVRLPEIVGKIEKGAWEAKPTYVFGYDQIQEAHRLLESHDAGGKIVVVHRD
jgi:NADPH:quinone reductase